MPFASKPQPNLALNTIPEAKVTRVGVTEDYCHYGCECPKCGKYLLVEPDTLAHFCKQCGDYEIPTDPCPMWGLPLKE